jgi:hypothetical protein
MSVYHPAHSLMHQYLPTNQQANTPHMDFPPQYPLTFGSPSGSGHVSANQIPITLDVLQHGSAVFPPRPGQLDLASYINPQFNLQPNSQPNTSSEMGSDRDRGASRYQPYSMERRFGQGPQGMHGELIPSNSSNLESRQGPAAKKERKRKIEQNIPVEDASNSSKPESIQRPRAKKERKRKLEKNIPVEDAVNRIQVNALIKNAFPDKKELQSLAVSKLEESSPGSECFATGFRTITEYFCLQPLSAPTTSVP